MSEQNTNVAGYLLAAWLVLMLLTFAAVHVARHRPLPSHVVGKGYVLSFERWTQPAADSPIRLYTGTAAEVITEPICRCFSDGVTTGTAYVPVVVSSSATSATIQYVGVSDGATTRR
jgi:hypothetical protein